MNISYPQITKELILMSNLDQKELRKQKKAVEIFKFSQRLKEIIDEIDFPTISKIGKEANRAAFLLIQHSDHDLEFQKDCLKMMKNETDNEVLPRHIAYLEDRIATSEGRLQKYGTQFVNKNGVIKISPVIDLKNLDKIRAKVGLKPISEYLKESAKFYKVEYELPE